MTFDGLLDMFEVDSGDTLTGKFTLVLMGSKRRASHAQTQERGPLSTLAEILITFYEKFYKHLSQ